MNLAEFLIPLEHLIGSAGKTDKKSLIAAAFLDLLRRVRKEDRAHALAMVLQRFDKDNRHTYGALDFGPPWHDTRWKKAIHGVNIPEKQVKAMIINSDGDPVKMAESVLEVLGNYKNDARVVALSEFLFSRCTPFNFFVPPHKVRQNEYAETLEKDDLIGKVAPRPSSVRFLNEADRAFYLLDLIKGKSEKEQAIILAAALKSSRLEGVEESTEAMPNALDSLFTSMIGLTGFPFPSSGGNVHVAFRKKGDGCDTCPGKDACPDASKHPC